MSNWRPYICTTPIYIRQSIAHTIASLYIFYEHLIAQTPALHASCILRARLNLDLNRAFNLSHTILDICAHCLVVWNQMRAYTFAQTKKHIYTHVTRYASSTQEIHQQYSWEHRDSICGTQQHKQHRTTGSAKRAHNRDPVNPFYYIYMYIRIQRRFGAILRSSVQQPKKSRHFGCSRGARRAYVAQSARALALIKLFISVCL